MDNTAKAAILIVLAVICGAIMTTAAKPYTTDNMNQAKTQTAEFWANTNN